MPLTARNPNEDQSQVSEESGQVDAAAHRDRPHRHRRARPRGGHRLLPRDVRRAGRAPRGRRVDGVEEALLRVAESYIQLLTPTRDDSPVAKYLEKKGEGLHHVGYRVADCAEALAAVKASGGRVIDEGPSTRLRGTTVAFVHPKGAFGTLIELVQE